MFPLAGRTCDSLGNMVNVAVTPQVNGTSPDSNNPLLLSLVVALTPTMSDKTSCQLAMTCPLDDTGSRPMARGRSWWSPTTTKSPLTLLSDPAGRIVASGSYS